MDAIELRRCAVVLIAIWLSGCAPPAVRPGEIAAPPKAAAKPPTDGRTAFLDGYRHFKQHDAAQATAQLEFAANHYQALGDYALYYLGMARRESDDLNAAAEALQRLENSYPQSAMRDRGGLALAQILLKLGRNNEVEGAASLVIARRPQAAIDRDARLVEAKALAALGRWKPAYETAMLLRTRYPRSGADGEARRLAYSILAAHPDAADTNSIEYHRNESGLLLHEGALALAAKQAREGLKLAVRTEDRAALTFLLARAQRPNPAREKRALMDCLRIAPRGNFAPRALEMLALIYWHDDLYESARAMFGRIVADFPHSSLAPGAMLRSGRISQERKRLAKARVEYRRLAARYPSSKAANEARFRAPWMLYLTGDYRSAAAEFAAAQRRAARGQERDRCEYWRARSLEKSGERSAAQAIFSQLALSIDSNYYPALASRRIGGAMPDMPAAAVPASAFDAPAPPAADDAARFHLGRFATLRSLDLRDLEAGELRALRRTGGGSPAMSRFVLGGFIRAGAWHDAIAAALRMEKSGEIDHAMAERAAYPRGYWNLIEPAALRAGLDPDLVLALTRQESLFDPNATSGSNARGLMQLLPSTAATVAAKNGIDSVGIELYDPALNVKLGTDYLRSLLAMFGGDEFKAVAAYNGGEHAVQKWMAEFPGSDDEWVENIGYAETRDYVKRVIGGRREYELLYGSQPLGGH
ncbi:MAG: transglycosylase SLT domain-containing protein [Candidatus Binataceae bacterium]